LGRKFATKERKWVGGVEFKNVKKKKGLRGKDVGEELKDKTGRVIEE